MKIGFIKNKNVRTFIPLALILILASALRLIWLDRFPTAINGDELYYLLISRSQALSGHDFSSTWNIFSSLLFQYPPGVPQAELPFFLVYPAVAVFGFSLFTSKIVYAILSIGTVYIVYLVALQIFDRKTALISAFITAVNPWQIYIGRTVYEPVPAVFFYLLGIYFLLKEKGNRIFIALPFFILGFYSYIGTKTILIPLIIIVSIFSFLNNKKAYAKQYLTLILICILFTLFFVSSFNGGDSDVRIGRMLTPFSIDSELQKSELQNLSVLISFLKPVLNENFLVYLNIIFAKIYNILSFDYLFSSSGEFVGIHNHGLFYFIDSIFLIAGLLFIFVKKRKTFLFLSGLILIGMIPQLLYEAAAGVYALHLAFFLPLLVFPIAYGISEISVRGKRTYILMGIIGAAYIISIFNFTQIYFFKFPLQGHFDFPSRVLANYIRLVNSKGDKVNIYTTKTNDGFNKYVYYSNSLNSENYNEIAKAINSRKYSIGKISFLSCGDIPKNLEKNSIAIYQKNLCVDYTSEIKPVFISRLDDGGQIFSIYNDPLCGKYRLKTFPSGLQPKDFAVESLTDREFCETFITR